jgi:hypothetical protein
MYELFCNYILVLVTDVFKLLSTGCAIDIYKKVKELLIALDVRGFMTMFGIRTSPGSYNQVWPKKGLILDAITKKHKKDRSMPRVIHPNNMSILTVGGRALAKHCSRSTEKFWGNVEGKSENCKNETAFTLAKRILDDCVWFNIHILQTDKVVLECRIDKGYGIRWQLSGDFIGFLECYQPSSP